MAVQQCEVLYKVYALGGLTRSNCANLNQWAAVDFNLGQAKRLLSIDANFMPRTDNLGSINGGLNAPTSPRFSWRGFALNGRQFMGYQQRGILYDAPVAGRTFTANFVSLQGSSENPVIKPECLLMGGFLMTEITVYFGADYTIGNAYYGRLYLIFTFEE